MKYELTTQDSLNPDCNVLPLKSVSISQLSKYGLTFSVSIPSEFIPHDKLSEAFTYTFSNSACKNYLQEFEANAVWISRKLAGCYDAECKF